MRIQSKLKTAFFTAIILLMNLFFAAAALSFDQVLINDLIKHVTDLKENIERFGIPTDLSNSKQKEIEREEIQKNKKQLQEKTGELLTILSEIDDDSIVQMEPQIYEILGAIKAIGDNISPLVRLSNLNNFNRKIGQIQSSIKALSYNSPKASLDTTKLIIVAIGSLVLILFLTGFALFSRYKIFMEAEDKDSIAEFAMKQTFGLPVGTIRGILALLISLLFVLSIFMYSGDIPEVVKVIVSLVFGFYFAKSTDQSKDIMDAMLGKSKQQAVKRQEAALTIEDARKSEAESLAPKLFSDAQKEFSDANQVQNASEAIGKFNNAIKKAREAKDEAIRKNEDKYKKLADETGKRIFDLAELKIDYRAVQELYQTAEAQNEHGSFHDAARTLERVKSIVDILLEEYDQAREIYEKKLDEEQRQKLAVAKKKIDEAESLGVGGSDLIEGIISAMGAVKEKGEHMIPLFKKRIEGKDIEASDVIDIFKHLSLSDDHKKLSNMVDIAINSIGSGVAAPLRDLLKGDVLEKVITGNDNQIQNIFTTTIHKSGIPETVFKSVVKKMRKNLIDELIEDDVKKALP
ncbi:MAG: hypothetical protein HOD85_00690, partial [Deltaproteobacteria bacterium]|nr:hypothetical protein [Deltaproteobacteria bacterium]